jgi:hypothetical protein
LSDATAASREGVRDYDLYLRTGSGFKFVWRIADHGIRLGPDRLSWTTGGVRHEAGFGDIKEIHLTSGGRTSVGGDSMLPMMRQVAQREAMSMSVCRIIVRGGDQLQVCDASANGLPDAARSVRYGEFVVRLHERLAATPAADRTAFGGGYSLVRYRILMVALCLMGLLLLGALVAAIAGSGHTRVFALAGAAITFWFQWKLTLANAPQAYDPADVPAELLPAPVVRRPLPRSGPARPRVRAIAFALPAIPRRYAAWIGAGLGGLIVLMILLSAGISETVTMFEPDGARHVFAAIEAAAGESLRLRRLDVTPTELHLTTEATRSHVDRQGLMSNIETWTGSRKTLFGRYAWDSASGPDKAPAEMPGDEMSSHPFAVRSADLSGLPQLARDAVQRAGLEDPGEAQEMTLIDSAPRKLDGSGAGWRWTVRVASARESAEIFFDGKGQFTGADLAGTLRVERQNLLAGGQDFSDLLHALRTKAGEDTPLSFIRVTAKKILLRAEDKQFEADILGVSENSSATFFCRASRDLLADRFRFDAVDWTLLRTITDRASQAATLPRPVVVAVAVSAPGDRNAPLGQVRDAEVQWAVDLRGYDGAFERATFDRKGKLVGVQPWDDKHGCE